MVIIMKKSISKKRLVLSVVMSAGILMAGCSSMAAESSKSTPEGSSTEVVQESDWSVGGAESGTNHISEKLSDKLVIDAEVALPKEQAYSVYVLTRKAFPREDLDIFFEVSEAVITDHPEWTGLILQKQKRADTLARIPRVISHMPRTRKGTITSYIWWNPHIIMLAVALSRKKKYRICPS